MFYIQPDECINCGLCVSVCPVEAIYIETEVPTASQTFIAANREFFGPDVTGWGEPGGAGPDFVSTKDHPLILTHKMAES